MKNLILTTAAIALTAGIAMADGHAKTIRLGTEGAYPPYNFLNDAGDVDGFEIELGNELCARAKLTCEWVTNEWDSIIPNLVSGNYDTIIAGMSITDERDEVIEVHRMALEAALAMIPTEELRDTKSVAARVASMTAEKILALRQNGRVELEIDDIRAVGKDWRISARIRNRDD